MQQSLAPSSTSSRQAKAAIASSASHTTTTTTTTTSDQRSMDPEAALPTVVDSASAALRSRTMVPSAMLTVGVFQAVAALAILFSAKTPQGIFSHHGKAAVFAYYGVLVSGVIVGLVTASASFWVARRLDGRDRIGTAVLCASTLTLIPVFGILAGFVMLRK